MLLASINIPKDEEVKDIDFLHKKYGRIFQLKDSFDKYRKLNQKFRNIKRVEYGDFTLILEDYYTFYYSSKMKPNAWKIFTMIRQMARLSGVVCLSYGMYCDYIVACGDKPISKPTFYTSLKELEAMDLIVTMKTIDVYKRVDKIKESTNTYAVKDKSKYIYKICDYIVDNNCTPIEAFYGYNKMMEEEGKVVDEKIIDDKYLKRIEESRSQKSKVTKAKLKLYVKKNLKDVEPLYYKFIDFLTKYNKSGRIALTRQMVIAKEMYRYTTMEFEHEDFEDAINRTIKNTGRNNKSWNREKYMFKILESMVVYDEDDEQDVNDEIISYIEEAEEKLKEKNKSMNWNDAIRGMNSGKLDESTYKEHVDKLKKNEFYYKNVLTLFSKPRNDLETKLLEGANKIAEIQDYRDDILGDYNGRMKYLSRIGISECFARSEKYQYVYYWREKKTKKIVSSKEINAKLEKHGLEKFFSDGHTVVIANTEKELEAFRNKGFIY